MTRNRNFGALIIAVVLAVAAAIFAWSAIPREEFFAGAEESESTGIEITQDPADIINKRYNPGNPYKLEVKASYHNQGNLRYRWQYKADQSSQWSDIGSQHTDGVLLVENPVKDSGFYRCKVYDYENLKIESYSQQAEVRISKIVTRFEIDSLTSVYGDEIIKDYTFSHKLADEEMDKISEISFRLMENGNNKEDICDAGTYDIVGSVSSDYYVVEWKTGKYTITPRPITVLLGATSSAFGEPFNEIAYELSNDSYLAANDTVEDLRIEVEKASGTDVGRYAINGVCGNGNYNATFRPATYTVTPQIIDARLTGTTDLYYSGSEPEIGYEFIGECPDDLTAKLTFDKAVKNAGSYVAYLQLSNSNYAILTKEWAFEIKKAKLVVELKDAVIKEGDEFTAEFVYSGFAEGEDENYLAEKPIVAVVPSAAGFYDLTPSGAVSDNYDITYRSGALQINVKQTTGTNAVFTGSFSPGAYIDMRGSGDKIVSKHFKRADRVVVFSAEIPSEGIYGEYTATLSKMKRYFPLFLRACIIDEEGNKTVIKDYKYDEDGNFVFRTDGTGVLVIYYSLVIPIVAVVLIVSLILIICIKKAKDRKRYRQAYIGHYIARQYANDMVNRNRY